jgi:DNA repair exonuclease SbcCD ATPase subunit
MFLRNVKISDFRSFPADFSLDITPGPGVTLIVGQNGLGKSTFFEALEWCFTGEVKRLRDLPTEGSKKIDFLARRRFDAAEVDRYGVELSFQPDAGTRIARWCEKDGAGYKAAFEPDQPSLVHSLRSPAWKEPVSDLGAYLRLTHFLSQSGEQRFAAQDSKQRWSALEAPAGTERLNRIRQRLGNKGVTVAFNRREQAAEEKIVAATEELNRWEELRDRRDNARKIAESGGAISPTELLPRMELHWLDSSSLLGELKVAKGSTIEDRLQYYGQQLESSKPAILAQLQSLSRLDGATSQWRRLVDAGSSEQTLRDSLEVQRDRLAGNIQGIQSSLEAKEIELRECMERRDSLARQRSRLLNYLRTSSAIEQQVGEEASINSRIEAGDKAVREATIHATATIEAAANRHRLEREFTEACDRRAAFRELRNLYSRWSEANSVAADVQSKLAERISAEEGLEAEIQALERDGIENQAAVRDAEQQLERMRFQATAIEAAVASIASVLGEQNTQCPVCASTFMPGELKALAASASSLSSAGLSSAESSLKNLREQGRKCARDIQRLQVRKKALGELVNEAEKAKMAASALEAAIGLHPVIANLPPGRPIADHLDFTLSQIEDRIGELNGDRATQADVADFDKAATAAEQSRRTAVARLSEGREALVHSRAEISRLEEIRKNLETESGVDPSSIESALKEATIKDGECLAEQEAIEAQIATYHKHFRERKPQIDALAANVAAVDVRIAENTKQLEEMRSRWQRAGLRGDPAADSYQIALDTMEDRRQRLAQFEERHRAMLQGYSTWLKSEEFRELQQKVGEIVSKEKASTESGVSEILRRRLDYRRSELASIQNAKEFREQTLKKLEGEAKEYASTVLAPLNSLNKSFLQVFSCFSNMSLSLGAKTHQSTSRLEFMLGWIESSSDVNTMASIRHFLSEGQLSALSVSLLLSMSIAYRWSRWRALLLDDPLQHNDIIHASSFIEVLRNLVRYQQYQVIVSTHDYQLADYIRRKMAAAKLDCRTCQFLGTKWHGVTHKVLY